MPEIGEVARIVQYIRQHLVGKTLAVVKAQHDENVFGKVGTSAAEFEKALKGKKILDAKQQGKYFWLVMSSPPHPLMHFGMAGWFNIRGEETAYYKPTKPVADEWPPKYWKFSFETAEEPEKPVSEAAFVDFRRFARIRLIDVPGEEMRKVSPLVENGPDPVIDKDVVSEEWLAEKCAAKKIPIKALLLDQANLSGIGNWVGDEILYSARIHPEQYSNTLNSDQMKSLHAALHYVTSLAVETKSDSSKFPEDWLFKHRWGKGKKDSTNRLPNGAKIVFVKVGGRTSAVVPSVQKKTAPVAGDVKDEDAEEEGENNSKAKGRKGAKKGKAVKMEVEENDEGTEENDEEEPKAKGKRGTRKGTAMGREAKDEGTTENGEEEPKAKGRARSKKGKAVKVADEEDNSEEEDVGSKAAASTTKQGSRSTRSSKSGASKTAPATNGIPSDPATSEAKPRGMKRKAERTANSEPNGVDEADAAQDGEPHDTPPVKKSNTASKATKGAVPDPSSLKKATKAANSKKREPPAKKEVEGRRRSARVSGAGV